MHSVKKSKIELLSLFKIKYIVFVFVLLHVLARPAIYILDITSSIV
jgi:hypothetical protein